jgi:hypothetical protein
MAGSRLTQFGKLAARACRQVTVEYRGFLMNTAWHSFDSAESLKKNQRTAGAL